MSKVISIRLSEEEHKAVLIRAIKKDLSVTEYVKHVLLRRHKKNKEEE